MMGKYDYQYRKDIILGVVVNQYIKTITPVSSSCIVKEYVPDLSSATVRNILAELEEEGFLTHPHTSAGRVPTQEGYRYYVDHLMREINLLEAEKTRIKEEYDRGVRDLNLILEKTSQMVAELTQCTSIISFDGWGDRIYCRGTDHLVSFFDLQDLQQIQELLRTLEEKKRILELINQDLDHRIQIYIGHELACSSMGQCALAVSSYHGGRGISGRIAVLGPTRMDYPRVVSTLEYVSDLMSQIL